MLTSACLCYLATLPTYEEDCKHSMRKHTQEDFIISKSLSVISKFLSQFNVLPAPSCSDSLPGLMKIPWGGLKNIDTGGFLSHPSSSPPLPTLHTLLPTDFKYLTGLMPNFLSQMQTPLPAPGSVRPKCPIRPLRRDVLQQLQSEHKASAASPANLVPVPYRPLPVVHP